jgi:CRP/FNR family transcriptional regulator, cyclic AMP receptor protein
MLLQASSTFSPREALRRFEGGRTTREYRDKGVVFSQGDPADAVFYLQSGRVQLTVTSSSGKEAVVAVLEVGAFFGEGCLAGQPLRMSRANSGGVSILMHIAKETMEKQLHSDPDFAEQFTAYLLSRNVRIEEDLVDQLFNSSEKRLARLLLLLSHFGKGSKPDVVIAKMSQDTLASMVGTTRSRVSHFLNRFRKMGFVDYDNAGLTVHRGLLTVVLRD